MILEPIHSESLAFAEREVARARLSAHRAMRHLDAVGDLPIPELQAFARFNAAAAISRYRCTLGKRAFEIRHLSGSDNLT